VRKVGAMSVSSLERAPVPAPILRDANPGWRRVLLHSGYDSLWIIALVLLSPWFVLRAAFDRTFRRMAIERLGLALAPPVRNKPRLLIHGVSVGEVKGAAPLVRALAEREPDLEIVISTTTETGLEVARQLFPNSTIVRFPIDLSPCVARFLRRIDPLAIVLIELEIWPNFLRQANRAGVPVAVVNGRITSRSFARYRWFRRSLPQFNRISLFCVQLEEYAQRFRDLGGAPQRVLVTGNMKADGLMHESSPELEAKVAELSRWLAPSPGQLVIVAGSTHAPEERWFVQACREVVPAARLVLVPRHPPRAQEVVRDLDALGCGAQLLTALRRGEVRADPALPAVVDTIGELEAVYELAHIVFVGGSLIEHGGQNMLEPAGRGRPVLYGPHVDNFRQEAALLETAGASERVRDVRSLALALKRLAGDPARRLAMGEAGRRAVVVQRGATQLTLQALHDRCLQPCLERALPASGPGQ
jgi:3-deoxy-D-manno-octulosonic-acid transferase